MKITTQESLVAKVGFFGGDKPPQYQLDIKVELSDEEKEIFENAKKRASDPIDLKDTDLIADKNHLFTIKEYGLRTDKFKELKLISSNSSAQLDRSNDWETVSLRLFLNGFYSFVFNSSYLAHAFKQHILGQLKELKESLAKTQETTEFLNHVQASYQAGNKSEIEL